MKKYLFLFVLTTGLIFTACKKDDDDNSSSGGNTPTPTPMQGTMTCKVNGTSWSASLAVVATESGTLVSVTGSDSNAHQLQINVNDFNGVGTYQLGGSQTNPNAGRWTEGTGQDQTYTTMLGLGTGTFDVTSYGNNTIKGTFSFTAKNSAQVEVSITDGAFEATFQ